MHAQNFVIDSSQVNHTNHQEKSLASNSISISYLSLYCLSWTSRPSFILDYIVGKCRGAIFNAAATSTGYKILCIPLHSTVVILQCRTFCMAYTDRCIICDIPYIIYHSPSSNGTQQTARADFDPYLASRWPFMIMAWWRLRWTICERPYAGYCT